MAERLAEFVSIEAAVKRAQDRLAGLRNIKPALIASELGTIIKAVQDAEQHTVGRIQRVEFDRQHIQAILDVAEKDRKDARSKLEGIRLVLEGAKSNPIAAGLLNLLGG